MAPFCMGTGITMGTNGLQWAGADPTDDCVMLWAQTFGVSSAGRAALASLAVFLLALLAQWLTSRSGRRLQEAKQRAKLRRLDGPSLYYDPQQGAGNDNVKVDGSSVNSTVAATVTSVSVSTRAVPAPASRSSLALPAASLLQYGGAPLFSSGGVSAETAAKVSNWEHLGDSALHGLRIFMAYLLMLAAMTYDVALIASTVLGFMLGYWVFTTDTSKVPSSADPCCS